MYQRKKKKKEKTTKKLYTSDRPIQKELAEKYMISRFLKVDVGDLITLGKELKIVTMDELKWSEGLYIRYLFLTGY